MKNTAIKLTVAPTDEDLFGRSKWWGAPDLPDDLEYPIQFFKEEDEDGQPEEWDEPLTFICQIRCEDIAHFDPKGLLPHTGMLYFFAAIGEHAEGGDPVSMFNGIGTWDDDACKVLYSPTTENLQTFEILQEDETPWYKPEQKITFSACGARDDGMKLLGGAYFDEIAESYPGYVSLLQVDNDDDLGLTFYDMGCLNIMIHPADLAAMAWDKVVAEMCCL